MSKYYYPAIFQSCEEGGYAIKVPDIKGCVSQGDNLEEAMWMASEAIGCMLEGVEEGKYPKPSDINDIDNSKYENSFVTLVEFDKEAYDRSCNPIKTAREKVKMSIKELSNFLGAPYRTVQDWNNGRRMPPEWIQKLIVEKIEGAY
ncbi:MAG: type II toxin-antitoxin system HicB family antitoxin [Selenomonadaceae bacterium]|nr:type II toxin-antitoxin system HicB family antitoxin [Selenomonadaceae bacterium]MBR3721315.1 type II toxin-antitoxin system HicB family antitoxin [Selenomonadaceae bacterium]